MIAIARSLAFDKDDSFKAAATDRAKGKWQAAVNALKEASQGDLKADLAAALASLEAASKQTYTKREVPLTQLASDAQRALKSVALAAAQLEATALENPAALGYAGKALAAATKQLFDANGAFLASMPQDSAARGPIQAALAQLKDDISQSLKQAQLQANGDAEGPEMTPKVAQVQVDVAALNAHYAKDAAGVDRSVANILSTLAQLESGELKAIPGTASDILAELLFAAKELARASNALLAAAKKDASVRPTPTSSHLISPRRRLWPPLPLRLRRRRPPSSGPPRLLPSLMAAPLSPPSMLPASSRALSSSLLLADMPLAPRTRTRSPAR